ncbi:uncharacterized protein LOC134283545 isoform X1 [Saccostrea cucullata]|uniref:uncharacterized protein LOC134283545 isoform X1 n=1 Tax=Saccostrea cuccullata TaxID=36930 RepID=UPI002ED51A22
MNKKIKAEKTSDEYENVISSKPTTGTSNESLNDDHAYEPIEFKGYNGSADCEAIEKRNRTGDGLSANQGKQDELSGRPPCINIIKKILTKKTVVIGAVVIIIVGILLAVLRMM